MSEEMLTEEEEHLIFAQWMDSTGLAWFHVPNAGKHKPQYRAKLKRLGLKAGVPDILIPTLTHSGDTGVAIELKRRDGGKGASPEQVAWLTKLHRNGWVTGICHGGKDASELVREAYEDESQPSTKLPPYPCEDAL